MTTEGTTCVVCGNEASLRCGGCKITNYCSKEHQKIDWRNHKKQCKILTEKAIIDHSMNAALLEIQKLKLEMKEANEKAEEATKRAQDAVNLVEQLSIESKEAEDNLKKAGKAVDEIQKEAVADLQSEAHNFNI